MGNSRYVTYLGLGLVGLAAISFFRSILPLCRTFPYSDEWDYLQPLTYSRLDFMKWLFAQHVDHRIPLQNVLHTVVLKLAGFDFRALVGVNFVVACAVAIVLMGAAKNYRGQASFGDLFIPPCALSLGAGFSQWSFEFQFLSSTFFVALFLYLTVAHELNGRPLSFDLALTALFACAWCGLNGMVISSVLTLVLVAYFAWERSAKSTRKRASVWVILAACAITDALLWIFWRPSDASSVHNLSVATIGKFFYGLFNSSLIVYTFQDTIWKFCILALLLVAALWFGGRSIIRKSQRPLSDAAMLGVLCATILLMLSVAAGRSKYESWVPGLEMHYGYLTIMMPIVSWIIVSSNISRKAQAAVGFLLVAMFAQAYITNWEWRFGVVSDSQTQTENRVVQQQIAAGGNAQDVARKYIADFFFVDTPSTRSVVASGIEILRRRGGRLYLRGTERIDRSDNTPAASGSAGSLTGACEGAQLIGFQQPESWGVWSARDPAEIVLAYEVKGHLSIHLVGYALGKGEPHPLTVVIDHNVRSIVLQKQDQVFNLDFDLPNPTKTIVFRGVTPKSPFELGLSGDTRLLGVAVQSLDCKIR